MLERVDERAEAGLDHVHPGCGPGEVQFLGDTREMSELTEFRRPAPGRR